MTDELESPPHSQWAELGASLADIDETQEAPALVAILLAKIAKSREIRLRVSES